MDNKNNYSESKNYNSNKNNRLNSKEDGIMSIKPETIKMDILLFKNDILKEIKIIEKGIVEKGKEINAVLKDKMTVFDNKIGFINDKIISLSEKLIDTNKMREEVNTLIFARDQLTEQTTTNRVKVSMLEKENRESINRIDEVLKTSIIYPGIIGIKGKFRNFHEFIDFLLTESNTNNNFRQKNIMDLSSYKLKIEKSLQTLGFRIENILSSCNSFTLRNVKDLREKFDYNLSQYKEKLKELRIENSNYVIQLEKDTKDLRNETNIVKSMKTDIFAKVDNDIDKIKKENLNIIETFNNYKKEFENINQYLKTVENKMDNLILPKIGILFDEQKRLQETFDNFKKETNEFIHDKINDKIKNIANEQIHNIIGDVNIKQLISKMNNYLNNVESNNTNNKINNYSINSNLNNINNYNINNNNYNTNNSKDRNNYNNNNYNSNFNNYNNNNIVNHRRSSMIFKRNSVANLFPKNITKKNNYSSNNINYKSYLSPKRHSINFRANSRKKNNENDNKNNENDNKINENDNNSNRNNNVDLINNNNIIMNKKILETLNNNNKIILNSLKKYSYDNNDNILSDDKNDNNPNTKKNNYHIIFPHKKHSFHSYSNQEELNNNDISNNIFNENKPIINKYSIVSRNKKTRKIKFKLKSEEENDYDNFIKIFNKNKNSKRKSFDLSNNEDLGKFQKLLKININDVDAKLNNVNSISSSFEILNENQEIYDRFMDSKIMGIDNLQNNLKNDNNKNNADEFNTINILSSDKNDNGEELGTKNIILAKTTSDFYSMDSNKKNKNDFTLNAIKNKNIFKTSKKNNVNNSNSMKKNNSDVFNLKNDTQKKVPSGFHQDSKNIIPLSNGDQVHKQSEESFNKYHNYFIGFKFGGSLEDSKKIKKEKRKIKVNNRHYQMMINEDIKMNNHRFNKNK